MPIAETEKGLGPIRCEATQLQIELRLYPTAFVGVSLFGRHQVRLQHEGLVFDVHAGLVSAYLFQSVLLRQLSQYLPLMSDTDT